MPIIPFGDEHGRLSLADRDLLWATMAYPREEKPRFEFMARFKLEGAAALEESALRDAGDDPAKRRAASMTIGATLGTWLLPHGGFQALADARGFDDILKDWYSKVWPGSIAGDILSYMLQMEISGIPPSVNKAVAITANYLRKATTKTGKPGPRSDRYIRQRWEDFKPVAHYWLAYRVWQFDDDGAADHRLGPEWFSPLKVESLRAFLALAELIAEEVRARPRGKRKSPIEPADFWRVPECIALPPGVSFTRSGLEPWAREILRRYKRKVV